MQNASSNVFADMTSARSQDAVIAEVSEQDVEEASTAEMGKRDASAVEAVPAAAAVPVHVEIAVGGFGEPFNGGPPLERFSSLGQRDGYESREASNGTGVFFEEKEEAGPSAETANKTDEFLEISECGGRQAIEDVPQIEVESNDSKPKGEQHPASSADVKEHRLPLPEEAKPLSKNAQKTLAKQERYKELKAQRKAMEKEKRHQETERKRREWQEKLANLSEEEVKKAQEEKLEVRTARKEERKGRKEKLAQAMATGQNIVIDLEFGEKMKSNEISSLLQQVMYSYAANGRAETPCRLSLTGCTGDIRSQLERISGFNNWLLHKEEKSYIQVFEDRKQDLVYLTADSENVLDTLDMSKIYIVGGLVDRNRWKGITAEKAKDHGIATAKLPIGEHMKMLSSQVLTVNQVVHILLCFMELGDWGKALFTVIPPRKRGANEPVEGVAKQCRLDVEQTFSHRGEPAVDAMSEVGDDPMPAELVSRMCEVEATPVEGFSQS